MTERIEVCRLGHGVCSTDQAVNVVYTAGVCRRTVEVRWDGGKRELVFSVKRPAPKRVVVAVAASGKANRKRKPA